MDFAQKIILGPPLAVGSFGSRQNQVLRRSSAGTEREVLRPCLRCHRRRKGAGVDGAAGGRRKALRRERLLPKKVGPRRRLVRWGSFRKGAGAGRRSDSPARGRTDRDWSGADEPAVGLRERSGCGKAGGEEGGRGDERRMRPPRPSIIQLTMERGQHHLLAEEALQKRATRWRGRRYYGCCCSGTRRLCLIRSTILLTSGEHPRSGHHSLHLLPLALLILRTFGRDRLHASAHCFRWRGRARARGTLLRLWRYAAARVGAGRWGCWQLVLLDGGIQRKFADRRNLSQFRKRNWRAVQQQMRAHMPRDHIPTTLQKKKFA